MRRPPNLPVISDGQSLKMFSLFPSFLIFEHPVYGIIGNTYLDTGFLRLLNWPYNLMFSSRFSSVIIFNNFKLLRTILTPVSTVVEEISIDYSFYQIA